jgi:hypothetical protein
VRGLARKKREELGSLKDSFVGDNLTSEFVTYVQCREKNVKQSELRIVRWLIVNPFIANCPLQLICCGCQ